jgi:glycosyltransferase involved in cell wall biosynthesis
VRVLAAHPVPDRYGADLMLLAALRALRERGVDVTVAVPEDGPLVGDLLAADVTVLIRDFPVLRKSLLEPAALTSLVAGTPHRLLELVRLIRATRPDVVYVNTLTLPHWIVAARLARRKVVCHVREAEDSPSVLVQQGLTAPLWLCHRIVTNSRHTHDYLTDRWHRLADRIEIVHNGFRFGPSPRSRPPRPDSELLLVGRLSPRKGQDVAIHALRLLHDRHWPVTLRLVGTAFRGYEWYVEELRRCADELGLVEHVRFDGYRTDIGACNEAADVVLVPSRVEPFGNVAVEALAANRPLVASAVGGLPEIVDHGETGLLVPPDDSRALADAVETFLRDPSGAATIAERGAGRVRERFSIERYENDIDHVLRCAAGATHVRSEDHHGH